MHRLRKIGTSIFNLVLSAICSPGIWMDGHGAIPFSKGAALLLGGPGERVGLISALNFTIWMLTFLVFSVYSWFLRKS